MHELEDLVGVAGLAQRLREVSMLQTTRQPLVRELRKIFGKAAEVAGMRLGGQMIDGGWIDDAYVYRIR
jgi:hypothetical protein